MNYLWNALKVLKDIPEEDTIVGGKYPLISHIQQDIAEILSIKGKFEEALEAINSAITPLVQYESFFLRYY